MLPISLSSIFSVNVITYVLPAIICEFDISKYQQGLLLCAIYIGQYDNRLFYSFFGIRNLKNNGSNLLYPGMVAGGFLWGVISDTIGRKKTLIIVLTWTTIFEILSSFSWKYWILFISKVLSGLT